MWTIPVPNAPVWMVHLDGRFPIGYDDATLQAIQASGGGTAGSVDEALTRLLAANGDIVGGYAFTVVPTNQVAGGDFFPHAADDDFCGAGRPPTHPAPAGPKSGQHHRFGPHWMRCKPWPANRASSPPIPR